AKIITSDPYKLAVGGIPRGSFLIMTPNNPGSLPPHFTLLRVTGVSLDCDVLGMFYADPNNMRRLAFSGDVNNVVSAHRYKVYAPDEILLNLIVNGTVKEGQQFELGSLRTMECQLATLGDRGNIPARISMIDFKGCRTAMFGKTRLGKSNVVK